MTWEQLQEFIKGKVFLIGITFINNDQDPLEHYQTSGTVES
jgi:hypothetical protein